MFRNLNRLIALLGVTAALAGIAPAQESRPAPGKTEEKYRDYFKQPETAMEYWAALTYEIEVGKFKLADDDLKGFLAKKPTDEELLQIEEKEGISAFLRLLTIPELREDAKPLVERVTTAVRKLRADPQRIARFVHNLTASPSERDYAIGELRKAGPIAVPYLIDALRDRGSSEAHAVILSALAELGASAVPALAAALDSGVPELQLQLLDVFHQRNEPASVPYLWYLSAAQTASPLVRERCIQLIAELQGTDRALLPSAKAALTAEAERFYRHQVNIGDPRLATIWAWDGQHVVSHPATVSEAEEYYGLRFAREALRLDPAYVPAQIVFLSLALEKGFEKTSANQSPEQQASSVKELLRVVNPDLISQTLERALDDHRAAVILGCVRALGDFGDVHALLSSTDRQPPLARALYYPDRRVELAAADAVLRIPGAGGSHYSSRVVEILRRMAEAGPAPVTLIASANSDRGTELAKVIQGLGFETILCTTGRTTMQRLHQSADVDVVCLDEAIVDPELPHLLAQLRADVDVGLLPVLVTAPTNAQGKIPLDLGPRLERICQPYRNVWVMPWTTDPVILKQAISEHLAESGGPALSTAERKADSTLALTWLGRLALGQVPGYDVRPAADAILNALHRADLAPLAIEPAGRLPGRKAQHELANVALREGHPEIQAAAATQLARHIQEHQSALTSEEVRGVSEHFAAAADPRVKSALGMVLGSLRPDARITGQRLEQFRVPLPARPAPAPAAAPAEDREKDADKDK